MLGLQATQRAALGSRTTSGQYERGASAGSESFLKGYTNGFEFLAFRMSDHTHWYIYQTIVRLNSSILSTNRPADLKADNFLIGFEDITIIDKYVRQQEAHPAPHVLRNGRPIYESRNDFGPLKKGVGMLKISDFSAAVFGDVLTPHNHDIQPQPFCAPEVLLKAGWSYSADVWNLGTVVSQKRHIVSS